MQKGKKRKEGKRELKKKAKYKEIRKIDNI